MNIEGGENVSKTMLKRVSKYQIKNSHELFEYCDNESFKAKNLRNLANYHIRQCFILSSKEELNKDQVLYLKDINSFKPTVYDNYVKEIANKVINELSKEEKEKLLKISDYSGVHFGLGLYIRNNYIYNKIYINNELPVKPYDIMILKK